MNRLLLACACALVAIAPAGAQRAGNVDARTRRVTGCYEVTVGRWVAGTDTAAIPAHRPPARFRLDSLTRDRFPTGYYQVAPSSGTTRLNIDAWRWIDSNRIVITWSATTVSGVHLDVRIAGDSLVGTAESFDELVTDNRPYPSAQVVARRTACRA